jgi:hypothetical protein
MMRRSGIIVGLLVAGILIAGWVVMVRRGAVASPQARLAAADARFHREVKPVIDRYCSDCHLDGMNKGDVSLDGFTNTLSIVRDRRLWERVLAVTKSGDMPPPKKHQPTTQERDAAIAWLDATLYPLDPEHPDPGRVTLRRLNRVEYNNTVRDLIGVDLSPADDFPQDDVGYGFDNIGDVLSLPPILWERYLNAAEAVLDEAIVAGPRKAKTYRFGPGKLRGHDGTEALAILSSNKTMTASVVVQFPGKYRFRVHGYGQPALKQSPKMSLSLDGKMLAEIDVENVKAAPKWFEVVVDVPMGRHQLGVRFLNDHYREWMEDEKRPSGRVVKNKKVEDRNLYVVGVEWIGPEAAEVAELPDSHRRIFAPRKPGMTELQAARAVVGAFATRAFRRPLATDELERLMALYRQARGTGDGFEAGVRHALTAVLVSPHFLFRGELQPNPDNPKSVHAVDEYALASRLSYFLWSSMPDDVLFDLASRKKLRKELRSQVARMLADSRSSALTDNFAGQWLQLRTLEILSPDAVKFPAFDADLRQAMRRETEMLFETIARENRPVGEFLTADYTFVNERLARHYGIDGVRGSEFVRVSAAKASRGGVLTHASILTLTSNPTRTSPVKRGKWVMENILGTPPPPPPPGVPSLESKELKGTLRERMEQHRKDPSCASCHERMDTIGFAFEHFDGVGQYRADDDGSPLATAGELPGGLKFADHRDLNSRLAQDREAEFMRCLSEKMLTYALGRGSEYYDRPALEHIQARLRKGGGKFQELLLAVVESVPFQMRRGEGESGGWTTVPAR